MIHREHGQSSRVLLLLRLVEDEESRIASSNEHILPSTSFTLLVSGLVNLLPNDLCPSHRVVSNSEPPIKNKQCECSRELSRQYDVTKIRLVA